MRRWTTRLIILITAIFLAIQLVPVERANSPVDPSKTIDAAGIAPPDIQAILHRSCMDCHSNETRWPWYSYVAPVSWLVAFDVHTARDQMNLSRWGGYTEREKDHHLEEICEQMQTHRMPDSGYTFIHRGARLSEAERTTICNWTEAARKQIAVPPERPQSMHKP